MRNPLQGKESMTAAHDIGNTAGINNNEERSARMQPWDNSFETMVITGHEPGNALQMLRWSLQMSWVL